MLKFFRAIHKKLIGEDKVNHLASLVDSEINPAISQYSVYLQNE